MAAHSSILAWRIPWTGSLAAAVLGVPLQHPCLENPVDRGAWRLQSLGSHSSILAWRISWTGEPGGCSPWGRKESGTAERLNDDSGERIEKLFCFPPF